MTTPLFDPRQVPVYRVDTDLPVVPASSLLPDALRRRFISPPLWEPEVRAEQKFLDRQPLAAAVLIPIVMREQPSVLLTLRTAHLSTHSGQIAFPGGKVDFSDVDELATAVREAHEETGLDSTTVEVLGKLPIYLTGSVFHVTPVVALVHPAHTLNPNPEEVADIFEVPLAFLMNPANHRHHRVNWQGVQRDWFSMPYQEAGVERFIWGATAGMLRNLYRFLLA